MGRGNHDSVDRHGLSKQLSNPAGAAKTRFIFDVIIPYSNARRLRDPVAEASSLSWTARRVILRTARYSLSLKGSQVKTETSQD
jgi:hypothetical protein